MMMMVVIEPRTVRSNFAEASIREPTPQVFNHTTKFLIDGVLNGAPFGGASISSSHEARTPVAST